MVTNYEGYLITNLMALKKKNITYTGTGMDLEYKKVDLGRKSNLL